MPPRELPRMRSRFNAGVWRVMTNGGPRNGAVGQTADYKPSSIDVALRDLFQLSPFDLSAEFELAIPQKWHGRVVVN